MTTRSKKDEDVKAAEPESKDENVSETKVAGPDQGPVDVREDESEKSLEERREEFRDVVADDSRTVPVTDPDTGLVVPPAPKVPDTTEADEALKEVREEHRALIERTWYEDRTEVDVTISGIVDPEGKSKPESLRVKASGGRLYVKSTGEVEFDAQGVAELRRALEKSFQAVA